MLDYELRNATDVVFGTLTCYDSEMWWEYCKFQPTLAFADIQPLFEEELRLLTEDIDQDAWGNAYDRIMALNLRLIGLNGNETKQEFLLHIQDNEA